MKILLFIFFGSITSTLLGQNIVENCDCIIDYHYTNLFYEDSIKYDTASYSETGNIIYFSKRNVIKVQFEGRHIPKYSSFKRRVVDRDTIELKDNDTLKQIDSFVINRVDSNWNLIEKITLPVYVFYYIKEMKLTNNKICVDTITHFIHPILSTLASKHSTKNWTCEEFYIGIDTPWRGRYANNFIFTDKCWSKFIKIHNNKFKGLPKIYK